MIRRRFLTLDAGHVSRRPGGGKRNVIAVKSVRSVKACERAGAMNVLHSGAMNNYVVYSIMFWFWFSFS